MLEPKIYRLPHGSSRHLFHPSIQSTKPYILPHHIYSNIKTSLIIHTPQLLATYLSREIPLIGPCFDTALEDHEMRATVSPFSWAADRNTRPHGHARLSDERGSGLYLRARCMRMLWLMLPMPVLPVAKDGNKQRGRIVAEFEGAAAALFKSSCSR